MNVPKARPLVCALGLFSALAWAQFKPAAQPSPPPTVSPQPEVTFSARVNLVRLLVSVRNGAGMLVPNLSKQDFHVFDGGVPQTVAVFERNTSLPLSVAILIDTSGSTQKDLHYEVESVLNFIPTLLDAGNPSDAFALFSFNWRTNLESDFSRNKRKAEHALRALKGEGGTSLYDAVYLAGDELVGREGRHVMVVVTDGGDTTSYKAYGDALAAAQRSDSVIYPIVVIPIENDAGRNLGGEHALATLAGSTGGRIFYPESFAKLDEAFADILRELRTQYLVGYYPQDVHTGNRQFHQVKVQTTDPSLKVFSRTGYYEP
jgi:Ca-activated chloride channel homolog